MRIHVLFLLTFAVLSMQGVDFNALRESLRDKCDQQVEEKSQLKDLFHSRSMISDDELALLEHIMKRENIEIVRKDKQLLWQGISNKQAVHMNLLGKELRCADDKKSAIWFSVLFGFSAIPTLLGVRAGRCCRGLVMLGTICSGFTGIVALSSLLSYLSEKKDKQWEKLIDDLQIKGVTFEHAQKETIKNFIKGYLVLHEDVVDQLCDQYLKDSPVEASLQGELHA